MNRADLLAAKAQEMGIKAEARFVVKDGKNLKAVVIGDKGTRACFYPELEEGTDAELLAKIMMIAGQETPDFGMDVADLMDIDKVAPKLRIGVQKADIEDNVATRMLLDINAYAYIDMGEGSVKVTKELLKAYGLTDIQLFRIAQANMLTDYTFKTMAQQMAEIAEMTGMPVDMMPDTGMYVLTNSKTFRGAGLIANFKVLDNVYDQLGKEFYILPSSVHELLIIPVDKVVDVKDLVEMVQEVNDTEVAEADLLSYSVYKYNPFDGLTIA